MPEGDKKIVKEIIKNMITFLSLLLMPIVLLACGKSTEEQIAEQLELGQRYLAEMNYEEAVVAFQKVIELDDRNVDAYLGLGQVYEGQAEAAVAGSREEALRFYEQAAEAYETALGFDETNANIYLNLSRVYIAMGDMDNAVRILEEGYEKTGDQRLKDRLEELKPRETSPGPAEEETDGEYEEPREEFYEFESVLQEDGMDMDADYLSVHIHSDRTATITVSGISLQDAYRTNLASSDENQTEYSWEVKMIGEQQTYSVATTTWAFSPGEEKVVRIDAFQHTVWVGQEDQDSFLNIGDASMSHTSGSITWTFTVPEEYPFDFSQVRFYEVEIYNIATGQDLTRRYEAR